MRPIKFRALEPSMKMWRNIFQIIKKLIGLFKSGSLKYDTRYETDFTLLFVRDLTGLWRCFLAGEECYMTEKEKDDLVSSQVVIPYYHP